MSCCDSDMKELLSLYVDDACSESEKQAVERHIAQCNDCRQELADLQWIVASLREMPDMPLPGGFTEAWQARLQGESPAGTAVESQEETVVVPLTKTSRKHWFQSRRFVGIAATVLLCFSVSVIGGHINTGYGHLINSSLPQELTNGEAVYELAAAKRETTALADDAQYNGGIFSDLTVSQVVRKEDALSSSSRDGAAVEHYMLEDPEGLKGTVSEKNISGEGVEADSLPTVTPVDVLPDSGEGQALPSSANAPEDTTKVRSTQNSQLQTKAARQMTVAQNASNREVYNGYMALLTEDVSGARSQVMSVAVRYDGYVNEETVFRETGDDQVRLEICVKSEYLDVAMEDIAGFGKVTAKSINRVDLSDAYYDAQGRLTRQRALEQSLLRLIAEADDVETVRVLEQELEKVTAEIEAIIANLEKISQQRKYSAIVVTISSDPLAGAGSVTMGDKFRLGFQSFLSFCKSFPDNLLVGFGFMFEIFAVVLILSILFYMVMHKLLRKPVTAVSNKNEPEK